MIGRTIGRYRIVAKLGEGGMGSVWKAEDPLLDRAVALKFLPEALAEFGDAHELLLREARAASRLEHPGIAAIHDVGEADGRPFIAMQLVEGQTVKQLVSQGPLPAERAIQIVVAACEALAYAHSHGVLHRDVTARNIMVTAEGKVVVVDFGLAARAEQSRKTGSGALAGTLAYMAPEVVRGDRADARSDLYGLGVVLFELLTGRLPFAAERAEAALYLVAHEPAPPPSRFNPQVSRQLDVAILKALAKSPTDRYETADRMVSALRDVTGEPTSSPSAAPAGGEPLSGKPLANRARSRILLLSALTATIGLAAFGLVLAGKRHRTDHPVAPPLTGSIAVLPLRNQSPSLAETNYLAFGLAERLAAKLTQVSGLEVIPWWSSQRYGDASVPLPKIAAELRAGVLLVGTFARLGDRIRGSCALVDGRTGVQRWVEEFEEPWSEIHSLQDRIALTVAKQLKGKLSGPDQVLLSQPFSRSAEAYDLYLKGREAISVVDSRQRKANETALDDFRNAIAIDPSLAPAYIGLGAALHNRYFFGWGGYSDLREAEASCLRALQLDNGSLEARGSLMRVYWSLGQSEKCLQLGQEARRLGKGGLEELFVRGEGYYFGGLRKEAAEIFESILQKEPWVVGAHWFLVIVYAQSAMWEKTIQVSESFLERYGPDGYVEGYLGVAYQALGNVEKAKEHYGLALQLCGQDTYFYEWIGTLHQDRGDSAAARWVWRRGVDLIKQTLAENPDNLHHRPYMSLYLASLGDRAGCLREEDTLLHRMPKNAFVKWRLAWDHLVCGDLDAAVDFMRQGLRDGSYYPGILAHMRVMKNADALFRSPEYRKFLDELNAEGERLRRLYVSESEPALESSQTP